MPNAVEPERRKYTRVNFNAKATLTQGDLSFETNLVDVSLNGILLSTPQSYEINAGLPAHVSIKLADDMEIRMSVRLMHSSSKVLGFKCESIDVDSIAHLRRLVELNIGDPHAAERVLNELVNHGA